MFSSSSNSYTHYNAFNKLITYDIREYLQVVRLDFIIVSRWENPTFPGVVTSTVGEIADGKVEREVEEWRGRWEVRNATGVGGSPLGGQGSGELGYSFRQPFGQAQVRVEGLCAAWLPVDVRVVRPRTFLRLWNI